MSEMVSVPCSWPLAFGVNDTEMVQFAPPDSAAGQLFVWLNAPLAEMLLTLKFAPPVLLRVTDRAALVVPTTWLAKVRLEGDRDAAAGAIPVPLRITVCGLPLASSKIVTPPFAWLAVCGVNVTLKLQLAPAATDAGQLFVCANGRLAWTLLMFRLVPPVFVNVVV